MHDGQLRILFVTDIHHKLENIEKLAALVHREPHRFGEFDLCLNGGDSANLPTAEAQRGGVEAERLLREADTETRTVIRLLETRLGLPVIHIPGNHDSVNFMHEQDDERAVASESSFNAHERCVRLAPRLVLRGVGGSCSATRDGKHHWSGYPYTNEEQDECFLRTLRRSCIDAVFERDETNAVVRSTTRNDDDSDELKESREDDQILLLTHVGPSNSVTTVDRRDLGGTPILCGSQRYGEELEGSTLQSSVVVQLHGHTHHSPGSQMVGRVPVINPGPLRDGRFGTLTLVRSASSGRWKLESFSMHHLALD